MRKKKKPDLRPELSNRELMQRLEVVRQHIHTSFHQHPLPSGLLACVMHADAHLVEGMQRVACWLEQEKKKSKAASEEPDA